MSANQIEKNKTKHKGLMKTTLRMSMICGRKVWRVVALNMAQLKQKRLLSIIK